MFGVVSRRLAVLGGAAILAVTGTSVAAQAAPTPLNWGPVAATQTPPARLFAAMTFDSARNRTVLFGGGSSSFKNYSDTWEFDGVTWVQRTPANSPPALVAPAMAFDSRRSVAVEFGGQTSSAYSADTWEWDGNNWTLRTFAAAPAARLWSTMAYDSARGRIVLFGGSNGSDLGDTWEYDGTSWTRMTPATAPAARSQAAMAYDPGLGRVVLFGGRNAGGRLGDTWEWDGNNWTQFTPSPSPSPRSWHSMAFDPQVGRIVLFAGDHVEPYALGPTNDTWEWDGANWTQDWTAVTPAARSGQAMALDPNGRLVMFGGSDGLIPGVFYSDTEELGLGIATPAGNPALSLPASQDFGSVNVGATSASAHVYVLNSGTGPMLTSISTTGDFAVSTTTCPMSPNPLAAGAACLVFYAFTPTAAGDRFGSLVFTGNLPGGSQSIALHGIGISPVPDFSISASPNTISVVQGSSSYTDILTTAIATPGRVDLSALVSPAGLTATVSPTTVAAGGLSILSVSAGYGTAPGTYTVMVTGTEGAFSHSTAVAVAVTLKGIVNGGFETGDLTGWTSTGSTAVGQQAHSGSYAGQMGSPAFATTDSSLAQTFSVPATGGKLVFWYQTFCPDKVKNDWFTVTLREGDTGVTTVLQRPVCSRTFSWTKVVANLSSYAGHSVTLTFLNHDDGNPADPTFTLVDDVRLI
ncbi:MAG TPA: kelch repeat-containing protein [Candidatus Dormibacteraeota bacterium]|jgi:hypothetical protein